MLRRTSRPRSSLGLKRQPTLSLPLALRRVPISLPLSHPRRCTLRSYRAQPSVPPLLTLVLPHLTGDHGSDEASCWRTKNRLGLLCTRRDGTKSAHCGEPQSAYLRALAGPI